MATPSPDNDSRLAHIPENLRIQVLYQDDDILVIHKPCRLRSVPGHADPPPTATEKQSHRTTNMSAQQAWVEGIRQLSTIYSQSDNKQPSGDRHCLKNDQDFLVRIGLQRLGENERQCNSVPRRFPAFYRYLQRSRRRIWGNDSERSVEADRPTNDNQPQHAKSKATFPPQAVAQAIFCRIERLQKQLYERPKPTAREESVIGQCQLWLGLVDAAATDDNPDVDSRAHPHRLLAVHRLDMDTSGLLVVARNTQAAASLSAAWRSREQVTKVYRAWVTAWPEGELGQIALPMCPHPTERLKWMVVPGNDTTTNKKECLTLWKVLRRHADGSAVLELCPITGRTHQLRVHCAATGGAIWGDALYGQAAAVTVSNNDTTNLENNTKNQMDSILYLHAERLSFPHPTTQKTMSFHVEPHHWSQH